MKKFGMSVFGALLLLSASAWGSSTAYVAYQNAQWVGSVSGTQVYAGTDCVAAVNATLTAAHAASLGGVTLYGQGAAVPCAGTNETISMPASAGFSFHCEDVTFHFANGSQPGVQFDTLRYGHWDCKGAYTTYSGTGPVYFMRPQTAFDGSGACGHSNTAAMWALDYYYDLGTISASGGTPYALIEIDPTGCAAGGQLDSSFDNNTVTFTGEANAIADYVIRINSPSDSIQVVAENQFYFNNIEGASVSEVSIGGNLAADAALGSNYFDGNISHTVATQYLMGIVDSASWNVYRLRSLESVNSGANVVWGAYWGQYAKSNFVCAPQTFGWGSSNQYVQGGPGNVAGNGNNVQIGGGC